MEIMEEGVATSKTQGKDIDLIDHHSAGH